MKWYPNAEWLSKEVFEKDYGLGGLVYHSKEPLILSDYHEELLIYNEELGGLEVVSATLSGFPRRSLRRIMVWAA